MDSGFYADIARGIGDRRKIGFLPQVESAA
jgi:hypothetical protein